MSGCRSLVVRACAVLAATLVVGGVAFVPLLLVGAAPASASALVATTSDLSSTANPAVVGQSVTLTDTVGASLYGVQVVPDDLTTLVGSGLASPQLIATDAAGNIYIAGSSGNEVSVLPAASGSLYGVAVTGGSLATLVSSGLATPTGVAVDPAGNLYISNSGNNTLSVLPAVDGPFSVCRSLPECSRRWCRPQAASATRKASPLTPATCTCRKGRVPLLSCPRRAALSLGRPSPPTPWPPSFRPG